MGEAFLYCEDRRGVGWGFAADGYRAASRAIVEDSWAPQQTPTPSPSRRLITHHAERGRAGWRRVWGFGILENLERFEFLEDLNSWIVRCARTGG